MSMLGQMMNFPLTITSVMRHAKMTNGQQQIVSITSDHDLHRYTFNDAFGRAAKLAHFFADTGIKEGDRIATVAWNDFRHFELYFGVTSYGAVCHTINPRLHPEQLAFVINDAADKILFVDPMFIPLVNAIRDKIPTVEKIVVMSSDANCISGFESNWLLYEDAIERYSESFAWPELDENTACSLCYTSGTTGNPKGVLYSHRALVLHSMAAMSPDAFGIGKRDCVLPVVPMFHVNAWGIPYLAAMVGCKLVFAGHKVADAQTLTHLFESEQVNFSAGVPTVWKLLHDHLKATNTKLTSLNTMVVGGTAMPPHLYRYFETEHDMTIIHAWGMTEMSPLGTINHNQHSFMHDWDEEALFQQKLKQGYPVYGVELKIVDEQGENLEHDGDKTGSLLVRGPWVMESYFNRPDGADNDGWFDTGDIASIDPYGYMKITDRKKDVIKSGGEWISSVDVENAMMLHPSVGMAAVIGVTHPKWDERPLLLIERGSDPELSLEEVQDWLSDKIAKWWLPDDVVYVDSLPLTATGKVHKMVIRDQYLEHYNG